jgi:hypothetical protein
MVRRVAMCRIRRLPCRRLLGRDRVARVGVHAQSPGPARSIAYTLPLGRQNVRVGGGPLRSVHAVRGARHMPECTRSDDGGMGEVAAGVSGKLLVDNWTAHQRSSDPMLAQVLAGTAGMLARAQMTRLAYTPHPLRERLLLRTHFPSPIGGARRALVRFIDSQQVKLYRAIDEEGVFGSLRLPPVVVEVIEEASTLSEVLPVALELRKNYAELRDWLGKFQRALDFEDVREVLARKKILLSVSDYLDHFSSRQAAGVTSVQISTDLQPRATLDARGLVNRVINHFGVRAQINRLVLIGPGRSAFHKFLRLLGEDRSNREGSLERSFYAFLARV